jgi:ABC-type phosphate transport system substrate-binding protein
MSKKIIFIKIKDSLISRRNEMKFKIIILFIFISCIANISRSQVVVIVNKSVKVSNLSSGAISNIYKLDKKTWDDGKKIIVFDSKESDSKDKFYSYIGQSPAELKKIWLKSQLTGEGKAPESLANSGDVVAKVGSTAGAIGYAEKSKVDDNVKIIATIP